MTTSKISPKLLFILTKINYSFCLSFIIIKYNLVQWEPSSLDKVEDAKLDLILQPFEKNLELDIPESEERRLVDV